MYYNKECIINKVLIIKEHYWFNSNYLIGTNIFQIKFHFIVYSIVTQYFYFVFSKMLQVTVPSVSANNLDFIACAFAGVHLPSCILLHGGNWTMSDYSKWYCIRRRIGVLASSWCISQNNQVGFEQILKHSVNLLMFAFPDGKHFFMGVVGMGIHYYVITKWPKFLFSLYFFSFGSYFLSIEPSKLTSSSQLHKYHKKCSPVLILLTAMQLN